MPLHCASGGGARIGCLEARSRYLVVGKVSFGSDREETPSFGACRSQAGGGP